MARYISLELTRLIRNRAYASGKVEKAARLVSRIRAELATAEAQHAKAKVTLTDIDAQLEDYPTIDPKQIRAIKSCPRHLKLTHGEFTREMVRYLRAANRPVSTNELRNHLSEVFDIAAGTTAAEREWLRDKVARQVRKIAGRGVLQRLHETNSNSVGLWIWTGR